MLDLTPAPSNSGLWRFIRIPFPHRISFADWVLQQKPRITWYNLRGPNISPFKGTVERMIFLFWGPVGYVIVPKRWFLHSKDGSSEGFRPIRGRTLGKSHPAGMRNGAWWVTSWAFGELKTKQTMSLCHGWSSGGKLLFVLWLVLFGGKLLLDGFLCNNSFFFLRTMK